MLKKLLLAVCIASATAANAWDWFGLMPYDEADTNRPPRLHRLLEKANDLIEQAEDEAMNGEGDKAISLYREALGELDRVERENPERAEKPEFAPLRNKKATCTAAIETIRFAQVNENQRAVTVSDSAALRKKYNKKHKKDGGSDDAEKTKSEKADDSDEDSRAESEANGKDGEKKEWKVRLKKAYDSVKAGDYDAADALLVKLLEERPTDLEALLLRAAAQCGTGNVHAARLTLEKANRSHPRSYVPYYNLAYIVLDLGEGEEAAGEYYNLGRIMGGPKDPRLESRLGEFAPKEKSEKGDGGKKEAAK